MNKISIIGAGNIASTVVSGLIRAGWSKKDILVCSRGERKLLAMQESYGISISKNNADALLWSNVVMIAVKPASMSIVLESIKEQVNSEHKIISFAAGVGADYLASFFECRPDIIRAMPNTPCSVNKGIIGLYSVSKNVEMKKRNRGIFFLCSPDDKIDHEELWP